MLDKINKNISLEINLVRDVNNAEHLLCSRAMFSEGLKKRIMLHGPTNWNRGRGRVPTTLPEDQDLFLENPRRALRIFFGKSSGA